MNTLHVWEASSMDRLGRAASGRSSGIWIYFLHSPLGSVPTKPDLEGREVTIWRILLKAHIGVKWDLVTCQWLMEQAPGLSPRKTPEKQCGAHLGTGPGKAEVTTRFRQQVYPSLAQGQSLDVCCSEPLASLCTCAFCSWWHCLEEKRLSHFRRSLLMTSEAGQGWPGGATAAPAMCPLYRWEKWVLQRLCENKNRRWGTFQNKHASLSN